jgi:hypothetical protein
LKGARMQIARWNFVIVLRSVHELLDLPVLLSLSLGVGVSLARAVLLIVRNGLKRTAIHERIVRSEIVIWLTCRRANRNRWTDRRTAHLVGARRWNRRFGRRLLRHLRERTFRTVRTAILRNPVQYRNGVPVLVALVQHGLHLVLRNRPQVLLADLLRMCRQAAIDNPASQLGVAQAAIVQMVLELHNVLIVGQIRAHRNLGRTRTVELGHFVRVGRFALVIGQHKKRHIERPFDTVLVLAQIIVVRVQVTFAIDSQFGRQHPQITSCFISNIHSHYRENIKYSITKFFFW